MNARAERECVCVGLELECVGSLGVRRLEKAGRSLVGPDDSMADEHASKPRSDEHSSDERVSEVQAEVSGRGQVCHV